MKGILYYGDVSKEFEGWKKFVSVMVVFVVVNIWEGGIIFEDWFYFNGDVE